MDIKNKKADIHFRISIEEKEMIEGVARENGKSLSDYARDILLAASAYKVTDTTYTQKAGPQQFSSGKKIDMHIRFSEAEQAYYIEQAQKAGCNLSEYIRRSANGNKIYIVPGLKELAKQIAKLGVNVNQLTILAHQGKIKEVDLFSTNDTLKQILQQLVKISKKR